MTESMRDKIPVGNYVSMKSEVVLRVGKWGKQTASGVSELEKHGV